MRIGLIGFGTIGRAVARAIRDGRAGRVELSAVLVRDLNKIGSDEARLVAGKLTADADEFFAVETDVIVEAAGHAALKSYAERALRSGREVLAVSGGALADDDFLAAVRRAAEESRQRLLVPSGAIGALDAISSGAVGSIEEITLIVRKPPAAWQGTPAAEAAARVEAEPVCVYEGRVREAAKLYPQNVNVAAALSLAGIGFDRTGIKIYADPLVKHNTFELVARGEFGELKLELKNRPFPENPKTGHLVVMSLIKAIRRQQERMLIGF
jgi:aspartate dehydrogenase